MEKEEKIKQPARTRNRKCLCCSVYSWEELKAAHEVRLPSLRLICLGLCLQKVFLAVSIILYF